MPGSRENIYQSPGGTCVPRINLSAVRGGYPARTDWWPDHCSLYTDCRTTPGQDPLEIKGEIESVIKSLGIKGEVELFLMRRGYEGQNIKTAG